MDSVSQCTGEVLEILRDIAGSSGWLRQALDRQPPPPLPPVPTRVSGTRTEEKTSTTKNASENDNVVQDKAEDGDTSDATLEPTTTTSTSTSTSTTTTDEVEQKEEEDEDTAKAKAKEKEEEDEEAEAEPKPPAIDYSSIDINSRDIQDMISEYYSVQKTHSQGLMFNAMNALKFRNMTARQWQSKGNERVKAVMVQILTLLVALDQKRRDNRFEIGRLNDKLLAADSDSESDNDDSHANTATVTVNAEIDTVNISPPKMSQLEQMFLKHARPLDQAPTHYSDIASATADEQEGSFFPKNTNTNATGPTIPRLDIHQSRRMSIRFRRSDDFSVYYFKELTSLQLHRQLVGLKLPSQWNLPLRLYISALGSGVTSLIETTNYLIVKREQVLLGMNGFNYSTKLVVKLCALILDKLTEVRGNSHRILNYLNKTSQPVTKVRFNQTVTLLTEALVCCCSCDEICFLLIVTVLGTIDVRCG